MRRGTTALTKVMRGTTAIQKIMRGVTTIWQNWILKTGNLAIMVNNSSPSPYTCNANNPTVGDAYMVFDNSNATKCEWQYVGHQPIATLFFGAKRIRITNFNVFVDQSGTSSVTIFLYGIREDNSEVLIFSGSVSSFASNSRTSVDTETPFKAVSLRMNPAPAGVVMLHELQITGWHEQG